VDPLFQAGVLAAAAAAAVAAVQVAGATRSDATDAALKKLILLMALQPPECRIKQFFSCVEGRSRTCSFYGGGKS
jgi:hypothetical protein